MRGRRFKSATTTVVRTTEFSISVANSSSVLLLESDTALTISYPYNIK
jgi:hypothetical protein